VWVESKNEFLLSRENYTAQLKNYLETNNAAGRTNIVVFSTKRKSLEKKYVKLKKRYTKGKRKYDVRYIPSEEFHFKSIDLHVEYGETATETPSPQKARQEKEWQEIATTPRHVSALPTSSLR